ncbi:hypothetical protein [Thermococcus barophilus]|uniref:Uncharacterized protein n=1 Tax=Thermococcus barophilus TaxID=55802 RepID=A0A0S1XER3_THEBA|nr:hypothetical protein [Thermococcus barophilus]ALM76210.1 conserved membrane hypothetical protein [Thermococcus barophilus]
MGDKKDGSVKAGPTFSKWSFRLVVTGIMALIAWYAGQHNVTAQEFNEAFASIPVTAIILAMFFDYGLDSGKLYDKIIKKPNNRMLGLIYAMLATGVFFFAFLWLITGNIATASAASVLVAGVVALITLLPNTGTSEWLLWLWLAETFVTAGKFITILPGVIG